MQIFKQKKIYDNIVFLKEIPIEIKCNDREKNDYNIKNKIYKSSCLKCINPKCIYITEEKIKINSILGLSIDANRKVCPVDAINRDDKNGEIRIDNKVCINCGLCISRCPIRAIFFNNKTEVSVNNMLDDNQFIMEVNCKNIKEHERMIEILDSINKIGTCILEDNDLLKKLNDNLYKLNHYKQNLFVRNLFITLGCNSLISRNGDVYTRLDAIYKSQKGTMGVVEIEFEKDTLGAVRNILDDIAVLHARYNFSKIENFSVVVCLQLPNERQGYWQVIKDINRVEQLKINTITVGAMLLLMWNNSYFDPNINSFYIDYDNKTIRKNIENQIGRKINLTEGKLGILEPIK